MKTSRKVVLLSLFLGLATSAAVAKEPRAIVFDYECGRIDADKTGFECGHGPHGMLLHFVKDPEKMPPQQRAFSDYQFNKIILRYFRLRGGRTFDITANHWQQGREKWCSASPDRMDYFCGTCQRTETGCEPVKE